ncbi:MAG: DMT family transporter [Hyphomicrobiaceae bacterium]
MQKRVREGRRVAIIGGLATAGAALALAVNNVAVPFTYAHGANAQSVVLLRYVFAILAIAATLAATGIGFRMPRDRMWHAFGSGLATAIGSLGLLGSYAYIPVSLAIVVVYTYPILTSVMQSVLERRPPGLVEIAALVVALAGVTLAIGPGEWRPEPIGLLLAAVGAIGFAGSFVWNGAALRGIESTISSFYMSIAGLVALAGAVAFSGSYAMPGASPVGWGAFLVCAVGFTLAFFGMFKGVELIGGAPAAMIMNLEPILTITFAILFIGETLTPARACGGALVIGAVAVSQMLGRDGRVTAQPGATP